MAKEEQSIHPGQLPYLMANLRNAVANVCRKSGVHPAIISMVLREAAANLMPRRRECWIISISK